VISRDVGIEEKPSPKQSASQTVRTTRQSFNHGVFSSPTDQSNLEAEAPSRKSVAEADYPCGRTDRRDKGSKGRLGHR